MGHFAYAEYTSTCVCLTFGLSSYYIMLIMSRPNNLSCRCIGINAAIYIALPMPSHAFPHLPPPPVFDHYHTIKTWSLVGLGTRHIQCHYIRLLAGDCLASEPGVPTVPRVTEVSPYRCKAPLCTHSTIAYSKV